MKFTIAILIAILTAFSASAEYRSVMTYSNSAVLYTPAGTSNLWVANSDGINAVINHPESGLTTSISNGLTSLSNSFSSFTSNFNSMTTNWAATLDGFIMSPVVSTTTTNTYWWDFGQTNSLGQPLIYATLNATNTVKFAGPTNGHLWSLLSIGVYANGADRSILFPTNLPFLVTNNMVLTNGQYVLTLTNAHLLRLTLESNEFGLEPQWVTKP
jgi:hypothetical protein